MGQEKNWTVIVSNKLSFPYLSGLNQTASCIEFTNEVAITERHSLSTQPSHSVMMIAKII